MHTPQAAQANDLRTLETPVLVLDRQKMNINITRMRGQLARLGVAFRPHVKTSKSIDVARHTLGAETGPITVSTLKEAEYFAGFGFTDIVYAVGITPNKFQHVFDLRARGVALTVVLDSVGMAHALAAYAAERDVSLDVMIEIDCDGHRSGVQPGSGELLPIAQRLAAGKLMLKGVITHAGNSYSCKSTEEIAAMSRQERDAAVSCAQSLRQHGFPCPEVSVGSTPTAYFADDLAGVTEVRAGVFVFGDLVMGGLGVVQPQDIAVSVLTSVVGHQRKKGWTIVDAGWMAMSRDRGTSRQRVDQGYGVVCNLDGEILEDIVMVDANQEHGVIAHRSGDPRKSPDFPVGTLLRILPNHACATCAQHDRYHVVDGGGLAVNAVWPRFRGW
ncbi:alanine racemase [Pseudoduganella sp. LjRoot289]|uniref:alanine racemase n=1 Tax=Pseudoduganella sp. LjRoot289 TaxID=3342314 RepID=UPI003ECD434D